MPTRWADHVKNPVVMDRVLAVALWVVAVAELVFSLTFSVFSVVCITVVAAAIAVRRAWPVGAFGVGCAVFLVECGAAAVWHHSLTGGLCGVAVLLYGVVTCGSPAAVRWALPVVLGCVVLGGWWVVVHPALAPDSLPTDVAEPDLSGVGTHLVAFGVWVALWGVAGVLSWSFGVTVRQMTWRAEVMRRRVELLDRQRQQLARVAAAGERVRVSGQVNDAVHQALRQICDRTDAALGASGSHAAELYPEVLAEVARTARAALAQTRHIVGVLREEGDSTEYVPQPSFEQWTDVVAQAQRGAWAIRPVELGDDVHNVQPPVQVVLLRIVQWAVSGAPPEPGAPVVVTFSHTESSVRMTMTCDQRVPHWSQPETMAERAQVVGGSVVSRRRFNGGHELVVVVPNTKVE